MLDSSSKHEFPKKNMSGNLYFLLLSNNAPPPTFPSLLWAQRFWQQVSLNCWSPSYFLIWAELGDAVMTVYFYRRSMFGSQSCHVEGTATSHILWVSQPFSEGLSDLHKPQPVGHITYFIFLELFEDRVYSYLLQEVQGWYLLCQQRSDLTTLSIAYQWSI